MATNFSEDVEELASQAGLPRFDQALGVDRWPAGLPVLMTSHNILKSWKRENSHLYIRVSTIAVVVRNYCKSARFEKNPTTQR